MSSPHFIEPMATVLEHELSSRHGPMMTGEHLRIALGYPSKEAFRQAVARKTTPIPIFGIEKRRGKFALTKDVAAWLAAQRARAVAQLSQPAQGGLMN
jgi:hypothetical protein